MKKLIVLILALLCIFSLVGCGKKDIYKIRITVPAGSTEDFVYSDEEICPTGNKITISTGEGLDDTEVILKTVNEMSTPGYVATPLTPEMPVGFDTDKGEWLKVGISMQNPTDTDIIVYVEVEGVEVRIE